MPKKLSLVDATRRKEEFVKGNNQVDVSTVRQRAVETAAGAKKKATFNLDADLHHRLKIAAATHRREMVDMVEEAVRGYLERLSGQ